MLVFVLSIAGLWWLLEAAAWRWSSRNFMVLVAGPGEVLVTLQGHWWLSDGCSHLLTAPSQGWLFPDVPFFGFLPQTSPGFAREEVLGCPEAEGDGAALWAVCHIPALPVFPWKNQRVSYGMWPRDAFSFRMSLNLSSSAAKPSAACVGHSLKTKTLTL